MADPTIAVLGPIWTKISDMAAAALFRHLKYMFCSKSIVEDLKSKNDMLLVEVNKMSRKAEQESNNGKILEKYVVDWQKYVQQNQEIITRCLEENEKLKSQQQNCISCLPIPHPISRYRLGKEAAKLARSTTELTATGSGHLDSPIAYLPLDTNAPVTEFQKFQSREEAYEKMEGLVTDDTSSILGIYGIAGAGKTRLMERITTEAGKKGTFHKVVRANVGKELDLIGIQEQLAGNLGCHFESKTDVEHRAGQLRSSLRQGGKILVILDDVWSEIPVGTIGIFSADGMSSIGGKILFTSRSEEVCKRNNCEHLVKIEPLTPTETWEMFSKTVGSDTINSLQSISVAKDICKRCGGLPLVILAVGNALKFKPLDSWKDARNQLKNSKIERVSGIRQDVYACLKLSFDNLEDDAKACLLLASTFPEDAHISVRELVQLARGSELVGSQLMKGNEIKIRVHSMIYELKSASLLLQGMDSEHIKLHDIIRVMAISIATKEYAFLFLKSSSLPNNPAGYSDVKILHIEVEETHLGFPGNVACPDLHTLSLRSSSSSWFPTVKLQEWVGQSQIFVNLRFLVVVEFSWLEKFSLESLNNLKTLWFIKCELLDFGKRKVRFLPEKLENLCFWGCQFPQQLNLSELNHLRKLEIDWKSRSMENNICLEPNTLSRLSGLEELCLPPIFYINDGYGESLPVLDEVSELSCLTSLHICSRASKSSKLATVFHKLSEFHLVVGEGWDKQPMKVYSVTKSIKLSNHDFIEGFRNLIEKAEEVILRGTNFTGISIGIRDAKKFIDLKYMKIKNCKANKYLASMSPGDKIQESLHRSIPFSNLIKLKIKNCPKLKYLFCNSIGRCLDKLEELKIENCPTMEEVVLQKSTNDGNIIIMSKLRIMILIDLPRLIHFYKGNIFSGQIQPLFNQMVEFPSLEELVIHGLEDITDIWEDNNDNASSQLMNLSVTACNKLKNVISPTMLRSSLTIEADTLGSNTDSVTGRASQGRHVKAMVSHNPNKKLQNFSRCLFRLKELNIRDCPLMEEVVLREATSDGNIINMSKLQIMILSNLPRLVHFYKDKISCAQIQPLFDGMVAFPSLEKLVIDGLEDITDIWGDNNDEASSFSQLETLTVRACNNLKTVIPPAMLRSSLSSEVDTHDSNIDSVGISRASEGHVKVMVSHNPNKKLQNFLTKIVRASRSACRRTPTITEENLNDPSNISVQVPSQKTRVCPLVEMYLWELPCLEKTGLNFEDQSGAVTLYPNLKRLDIDECNRLENVFISFTDTHFLNLEDMSVTKCMKMREIIGAGKQKNANGIVFHKLFSLKLSDLPGLTSFWGCPSWEANSHKVEFPKLESLELSCGNITSLEMIELGSRDDSIFRLEELEISCDEEIQIPNQWLPHLNNLESLIVERWWPDELKSLQFPKLKSLALCGLSCSTLFSFPDFERLQQLRYLEIRDCNSLEHIVEVVKGDEASGMDTDTIALVQLQSVILVGLPTLKSFMDTKSNNLIRSLEEGGVEPSILFTCSVSGNLQQLKMLKVIDCRLLEGIVEVARGYQTDRIITFPKLLDICLIDLPNLQNFSPTTSYSFNMPKLKYFYLFGCSRLGNKPFLQIIAQQIRVYSNEHPTGIDVLNLNEYTRRINKLESVGESSNSHQDVEMETIRVAEEEERVVEQAEEGVVQEENEIQKETLKS